MCHLFGQSAKLRELYCLLYVILRCSVSVCILLIKKCVVYSLSLCPQGVQAKDSKRHLQATEAGIYQGLFLMTILLEEVDKTATSVSQKSTLPKAAVSGQPPDPERRASTKQPTSQWAPPCVRTKEAMFFCSDTHSEWLMTRRTMSARDRNEKQQPKGRWQEPPRKRESWREQGRSQGERSTREWCAGSFPRQLLG